MIWIVLVLFLLLLPLLACLLLLLVLLTQLLGSQLTRRTAPGHALIVRMYCEEWASLAPNAMSASATLASCFEEGAAFNAMSDRLPRPQLMLSGCCQMRRLDESQERSMLLHKTLSLDIGFHEFHKLMQFHEIQYH